MSEHTQPPCRPYSLALYEKAFPSELSLEEKLFECGRLGFDSLELSIDETDARLARLEWTDAEICALVNTIRESRVPIRTMCLSGHRKYPLGASDAAIRERGMDIMKKALELSSKLGISIIQLAGYDVYYEQGTPLTREYFRQNLMAAVDMAAAHGILLGFETMETPFMDTVGKAMKYVSACSSPWLGVYPDIGNLKNAAVLYGGSVTEDILSGRGHILAMHLKETRPGIYRDMRFGTGHTEYLPCLLCAKELGVRMFTGEFWHQPGEDYRQVISKAAAFLRERLDSVFCP